MPRQLRPVPFDPTDIDGVHWPELFRPEVHKALLEQEGEAGLREREAASDPLGVSWRVQVGCEQGGARYREVQPTDLRRVGQGRSFAAFMLQRAFHTRE